MTAPIRAFGFQTCCILEDDGWTSKEYTEMSCWSVTSDSNLMQLTLRHMKTDEHIVWANREDLEAIGLLEFDSSEPWPLNVTIRTRFGYELLPTGIFYDYHIIPLFNSKKEAEEALANK